ncbi:MAG: hypothetical protein SCARUB_00697 [Candidatus Scalindua rubra]|uniref:Uncharacterized protein n=1 Tax=Candidatus Scalindua rubra TaxID=1872076 RepID=A0A1E3XER2_9BACT|nr:MAG: hypothetical protein SCARUB_00697 [Candidatus Scalindua rubra]
MSAVLEQYFQTVVVDKINETISKQFQEIKDDLDIRYNKISSDISGLRNLESNYNNLLNEIESLKKQLSASGQEISGTIQKGTKELSEKIDKKLEATKTTAPAKNAIAKKPTAKKTAKK